MRKKLKNLHEKFIIDESKKNDFLNSKNHDLDNCIICKSVNNKLFQKYILISKVASVKQTN